jgi:hypothetical protein
VWARLKRGKERLLEGCDPNPSHLKVHNKVFIAKQAKRVGVGHVHPCFESVAARAFSQT